MYESNTEVIKSQMASTRSSLTDKIETLENKVVHSVETTGAAVERTVDKVLGTVENATATVGQTIHKVTSTVGGAVDSIKDRVASTEESVKSALHSVREHISLPCLVRHNPWVVMGGAVVAGYFLDHLLEPSRHHGGESRSSRIVSPARLTAEGSNGTSHADHSASESSHPAESKGTAAAAWLSRVVGPHTAEIRGLAVGSLMSVFRDVVTKSLVPAWSGPIANAIDDLTRELGGKPVGQA